MEESGPTSQVVRFGVFEVDLRAGELRKSGLKIKVQEQPMQFLAMLLEHPGEVVTREELRQKLWSADTFVDLDHSLNAAIQKLRHALGDSADSPRFVETVARRGYRFIAPVSGQTRTSVHEGVWAEPRLMSEAEVPPSEKYIAQKASPEAKDQRTSRKTWLAAGLVLLLLVGVATWVHFYRRTSESSVPATQITPFTSFPGLENDPAFSPDGKQIAFSWDGEKRDNHDIYVKLVGTESLFRLTSHPGADLYPTWSPDGRYIAIVRHFEKDNGIFIVPALGGPERKVQPLTLISSGDRSPEVGPLTWFPEGLDWSPDGKFLAFLTETHPRSPVASSSSPSKVWRSAV